MIFNKCIINEYVHIELEFKINLIDQFILFHFDHYFKEIEFTIKDFKIMLNY